jgi:hypothetical protein
LTIFDYINQPNSSFLGFEHPDFEPATCFAETLAQSRSDTWKLASHKVAGFKTGQSQVKTGQSQVLTQVRGWIGYGYGPEAQSGIRRSDLPRD